MGKALPRNDRMQTKGKGGKAQAAIDFLVSYGITILTVTIAIYIALQLSVFQPQAAPVYCSTAGGFTCKSLLLSQNGVLTISLVQATGSQLNIIGAACASAANSIGNRPAYGNVNVLKYSAAPAYYPDSTIQNGLALYTDNATKIRVYCYGPGGLASGKAGSSFTGYLWLNYTSTGLPSSMRSVIVAASFSGKYS